MGLPCRRPAGLWPCGAGRKVRHRQDAASGMDRDATTASPPGTVGRHPRGLRSAWTSGRGWTDVHRQESPGRRGSLPGRSTWWAAGCRQHELGPQLRSRDRLVGDRDPMPTGRSGIAAVAHRGRLYVFSETVTIPQDLDAAGGSIREPAAGTCSACRPGGTASVRRRSAGDLRAERRPQTEAHSATPTSYW
jgi:hypothetical protein